MSNIEIGDVVQLAADRYLGSEINYMTVADWEDGDVVCQWFANGEMHMANCSPASLVVVAKRSSVS